MRESTPARPPSFRVTAHWSAVPSLLALWAGLALAARRLLHLQPGEAALAAGVTTAGHVASEIWHQLGHAAAAALTGYPMSGLRFWGPFSASIYPRDEPPLPAGIHIRRALGGPIASALLTLVLGWITRAARPSLARRVLWALCLENLLVFTLQVFVPLGFNDGATLRTWMRARERR